jgi:DNA repair exonuclease SbcCD ATPase subunit
MSTTSENASNAEHLRYEISQLEKMREQILSDMENLRTQETNLRAFEARLRGSCPPQAGFTNAPMGSRSPLLDAEWEKFQRSRALLEAERRALNDDRMALRDEKGELQQRDEALRKRESWIEVREKELAAKAMPPPKAPSHTPFEMAKNLFSLRRAS